MPYARSSFLLGLAAGAAAAMPRAARAQSTKLRLAAPVADVYAEPFYVTAAGAFAKAGFDVEVTTVQTGTAVAAALASGAIDLGIVDVVSTVNAIVKGVPLQLVAGGGLYRSTAPYQIVAVAKDGPIHTPRDLEGRTFALPQIGGIGLAATRAWLRQSGVDPAKVNFIESPQAAMTAGIKRGTFDAAALGEPFLVPNRNAVRDIGHPLDAIAKEFLVTAWVAPRAWVEQDRARARRAVAAIYDTARWANAHQAETLAILARESKLELSGVAGMIRTPYATSLTPAVIQPVLNIATEFKLIDQQVEASSVIVAI